MEIFTSTETIGVGQNWHISVPNHLGNHHNTQLNVATKNEASNRNIYRALSRLCSFILCG